MQQLIKAGRESHIRFSMGAISLLTPLTGIGQYTRNLSMELERMSWLDVNYFYGMFWGKGLSRQEPSYSRLYRSLKSPVKKFLPRPYETARFLHQAVFTLGAKYRAIDLYHEPNFIPFRFPGPTVITVHDLSIIRYPEMHPQQRVKSIGPRLKNAVARADGVITVSDFTRSEVLSEYGTDPDKVTTVYPGVSRDYHPMSPAETKPVLVSRGLIHGRYILTVGTLEPRKNLPRLLEAYKQLPQNLRKAFPLVVVGMRGWRCEDLERDLAALGRAGQLIIAGYVDQKELPVLYAGAALLAYPSLYEGFGLPPLEAMASGVPVVASNRSSIPEVVGDTGVLVDPEDKQAIADTIKDLLEDKDRRRRMAEAGIKRASQFSWQRCAHETAEFYQRVLRKAGRTT